MKAFHNDEAIKQKYLKRVEKHRLADELVQGVAWQDGKGCAVGCTLESYNHAQYEKELGIPEWLARVEDTIFEGLTEEDAQMWPERFLAAIHPGADLDKIKHPFIIFVLQSNLKNFDHKKCPAVAKATNDIIALHERDEPDESPAWRAAWRAAENAADDVAWRAAQSATQSAAWHAAWNAAWSAAQSEAWRATWSAARSGAQSEAYKTFSDKLIELLEGCK